jgi:hypothetical protein
MLTPTASAASRISNPTAINLSIASATSAG